MILTLKPGRENKVHLFIDGEYRMTVDQAFLANAGLKNEMNLTDAELALLTEQVNSRRAFNKGCDLLARRDHSRFELLTKLRQKGFGAEAEETLDRLEELGYLDDARFAAAYAAELQRCRHFGKKRIEQALLQKGVDRAIIRDVLDELTFDPDDLRALIERKYFRSLSDDAGVQKTVSALVRLGYSYAEIKAALSTIQEEQEGLE